MSDINSWSNNRLEQEQVSLLQQLVSLSGGTPTSSRLVSVNPTGGEVGSGTANKTFPEECRELEVCNDSDTNNLTFTVGSFSKRLLPMQTWYGPVEAFTQVNVNAPSGSPWTVNAQALQTEA